MVKRIIKTLKTISNKLKSIIFDIKYKTGIAREGKDFCTCGMYTFCSQCGESYSGITYKPCDDKNLKNDRLKYFISLDNNASN